MGNARYTSTTTTTTANPATLSQCGTSNGENKQARVSRKKLLINGYRRVVASTTTETARQRSANNSNPSSYELKPVACKCTLKRLDKTKWKKHRTAFFQNKSPSPHPKSSFRSGTWTDTPTKKETDNQTNTCFDAIQRHTTLHTREGHLHTSHTLYPHKQLFTIHAKHTYQHPSTTLTHSLTHSLTLPVLHISR